MEPSTVFGAALNGPELARAFAIAALSHVLTVSILMRACRRRSFGDQQRFAFLQTSQSLSARFMNGVYVHARVIRVSARCLLAESACLICALTRDKL